MYISQRTHRVILLSLDDIVKMLVRIDPSFQPYEFVSMAASPNGSTITITLGDFNRAEDREVPLELIKAEST